MRLFVQIIMAIKLYKYSIIITSTSLFLLTIFCTCNLQDCTEKDSLISNAIKEYNKDTGAFARDIPVKNNGYVDNIYIRTKEMQERLRMEKIDSGYNNFQIRITKDFDKSGDLEVLSIKCTDNQWKAIYYVYNGNENDTAYANVKMNSTELFPKKGWCHFVEALFSQNILNLPTIEKVPILSDVIIADGGNCYFEIASKNKYRFYYYYAPELLSMHVTEEYKESKNVIEIFNIIEENFNFKSR
jgi:hypothetical protein